MTSSPATLTAPSSDAAREVSPGEQPLRSPFGFDAEALMFYDANDSYRSPQSSGAGGVGIGALAAFRAGAFRVGASADMASSIFGPGATHFGAFGGADWLPLRWLRLTGALELGGNYMSDIGGGLFVSSLAGDSSILLPYAGVRTSAVVRIGHVHHFLMGLTALAREDLGRGTVTPQVTSCLLSCSSAPETWRVGGESVDLGLTLGFEL